MSILDYVGRSWNLGNQVNCFNVIEEWYSKELGIEVGETWNRLMSDPEVDTEWNWWERVSESYYETLYEEVGFREIPLNGTLQVGDSILFCMASKIPNHSGIIVGEKQLLHHMAFGDSCVDPFFEGSTMYRRAVKAVRHASQFV